MEPQTLSVPDPSSQEPVDPQLAEATGTPPPPKDSFVMSFIPKKDLAKFLPLVLILFLVVSLPLAVVLVRRRQAGIKAGGSCMEDCRNYTFGLAPPDPEQYPGKCWESTAQCLYYSPEVDNCPESSLDTGGRKNVGRIDCGENQLCCCRWFLADCERVTPVPTEQKPPEEYQCFCDKVIVDKNLDNLAIGDVVNFAGFGKTNYPPRTDFDPAIGKIKFVISKNGTVIKAQEVPAAFDREEGGWNFYKADFSFVVPDYGDYEAAIQVACPGGWTD